MRQGPRQTPPKMLSLSSYCCGRGLGCLALHSSLPACDSNHRIITTNYTVVNCCSAMPTRMLSFCATSTRMRYVRNHGKPCTCLLRHVPFMDKSLILLLTSFAARATQNEAVDDWCKVEGGGEAAQAGLRQTQHLKWPVVTVDVPAGGLAL